MVVATREIPYICQVLMHHILIHMILELKHYRKRNIS